MPCSKAGSFFRTNDLDPFESALLAIPHVLFCSSGNKVNTGGRRERKRERGGVERERERERGRGLHYTKQNNE
jgi:hypothetical protein